MDNSKCSCGASCWELSSKGKTCENCRKFYPKKQKGDNVV